MECGLFLVDSGACLIVTEVLDDSPLVRADVPLTSCFCGGCEVVGVDWFDIEDAGVGAVTLGGRAAAT